MIRSVVGENAVAGRNHLSVVCAGCAASNALSTSLRFCTECGNQIRRDDGIIDVVRDPAVQRERDFYDAAYSEAAPAHVENIDWVEIDKHWTRAEFPERQIVLNRMGDLRGKSVLLLGNGDSDKELGFLRTSPGLLVYSDLSLEALVCMKNRFNFAEFDGTIEFVSLDAQDIPFDPNSFDIVYGYAMVHHLPDLPKFFQSVQRVLKPGGQAVFMDDAYSPLWHQAKQSWLKPVMKYSHAKTGISPEDLRFSMSGGFNEDDLAVKIAVVGGVPWFHRTSLLAYIVPRGVEKLAPKWVSALHEKKIAKFWVRCDRVLAKFKFYQVNQIRLVWGFNKPL